MTNPNLDHLRQQLQTGQEKLTRAVRQATRPFRIKAICVMLLNAMTRDARKIGWAITSHGSMTRDLDLVAVPWTDEAVNEADFIIKMQASITKVLGGVAVVGAGEDDRTPGPKEKPHGRRAWTLHSTSEKLVEDEAGAHPYVDLSVMDFRAK